MGDEYGDFFEKPYRPIKAMSKSDISAELQQWRNLHTWLDTEVTYWLTKVGQTIRVCLRNGQVFKGELGAVQYEAKTIRVSVFDRIYDYARGVATYEQKDVVIKMSDFVDYQFIFSEEVRQEGITGEPDEPSAPPQNNDL